MSTTKQYRSRPREPIVLEQLSDQLKECYERAAEARAKADASNDPTLKADFLDIERRWLALAGSYGFTESLQEFATANAEWQRKIDGRLPANTISVPTPPDDKRLLYLASVVETSDDAIITKGLDTIITSWNKAAERIFGYAAEEAIGQSITMLIPLDRYNEEPAILARIRRGERIDHYETVRRRKDGSLIDISITVSPIKSDQGEVIGASKIARDSQSESGTTRASPIFQPLSNPLLIQS
jgi:PAS domain S-box-containing protein